MMEKKILAFASKIHFLLEKYYVPYVFVSHCLTGNLVISKWAQEVYILQNEITIVIFGM